MAQGRIFFTSKLCWEIVFNKRTLDFAGGGLKQANMLRGSYFNKDPKYYI